MAQNPSFKYLTFALVGSLLGGSQAQAYFSSDNLFCSSSYSFSSPFSFVSSTGGGTGKVSVQDLSIMKRFSSPPLDSSVHTFDFDFTCVASWSWGVSQGGSAPSSGGGSGRCTFSTLYLGSSDGFDHFATELSSLQLDLSDSSGSSSLRLRESPSRPSRGSWDLATLKGAFAPGPFTSSLYEIHDSMDVSLDASFDGGQSWISSSSPVQMQGTPEPASMAAMGVGIVTLLRRRIKKA